jgi:NADH-quinone oxidoreductase subunit J
MVLYVLLQSSHIDYHVQLGGFVKPTKDVAMLLFRDFLLPFEVTSVLVLIAIMGAVVLARREP